MKFHPDKCKVFQIHENEPLCTKVLPLAKFGYYLNNDILDYTECEKDLGVLVNKNFKWDDHQLEVLNKAHQMLGTVRPLLSADLVYPRFLRPKLSTPYLYEIQSNLHYSHLYYPRTSFIRGF